jgi:hypothetical protein
MAAMYGLGQSGEEDKKDKVTVETDLTSSDAGVIKVGNVRIDPWAGKKTTIVAMSRLFKGGRLDKYGNFKEYGNKYEDTPYIKLPLDYAGNKLAPGIRAVLERTFLTEKVELNNGESFREDKWGVDFKESDYLTPLVFDAFSEVNREQPGLFGKAVMAISWTGLVNTNVYDGYKEGIIGVRDNRMDTETKEELEVITIEEGIFKNKFDKLAKDAFEEKLNPKQVQDSLYKLVQGDPELYNKKMESLINKVDKENVKKYVTDAFFIALEKENNPEKQAIMYYSQFKDGKGLSKEVQKDIDKNSMLVKFKVTPEFLDAYRRIIKLKSEKKAIN